MHTTHFLTNLAMSFSSLGQKKFAFTRAKVFASPKCPPNVPPCDSSRILNLKEQDGMHRVFPLKRKPSISSLVVLLVVPVCGCWVLLFSFVWLFVLVVPVCG